MIEVGRYLTMVEADLARLLLGSYGIEALVLDSQMNNFYGGVAMPVRLVVDDEDEAEALAVLAENRS
jgi:hypothetical protein